MLNIFQKADTYATIELMLYRAPVHSKLHFETNYQIQ